MHEMMANSTKWTEGCVVGSCLHEVKTQTGAELVLLAALTGSGTSFGYVVTLVRTDTGRMLAQDPIAATSAPSTRRSPARRSPR